MSKDRPDWLPDEAYMLEQPLTTEDGFVNPACLAELKAAIKNIAKTYNRMAGNAEWSRKDITGVCDIVGAFISTAIEHARGVPPNIQEVAGFLHASLKTIDGVYDLAEDLPDFLNISLVDINRELYERAYNLDMVRRWNDEEFMKTHECTWIDLDALLHMTCVSIRNRRRHDRAFDVLFAERHKEEKQKACNNDTPKEETK